MRPGSLVKRVAVAVVGCAVLAGCSSEPPAAAPPVASTGAPASSAPITATRSVDSEAFARRMAEPGVVTINVHVPDEGSIAGTDLTIPFDQITGSTALPADRSTPLAVYCRSGNMSADAMVDLEAMGYTDLVELEGGFNAWQASGRPLQPPV